MGSAPALRPRFCWQHPGPMDAVDFKHLVRISEQDSAAQPARYRRHLAFFAALGYAWVLACLLLALAMLGWVLQRWMDHGFRASMIWIGLSGLALLWGALSALWLRLQEPEGVLLRPEQAPGLFEALERIRKAIKGPPLHSVRVDAAFNASIVQLPRWGLLGAPSNHLVVGLPLLYALDRRRMLAVLAHEYGHLRGGHGQFSAWVYRSRMAWQRLAERMGNDESVFAAANRWFFRWYAPRFAAKSFALARQDEYEADRVAARLLGADVTVAALKEIEVRAHWLDEVFWPRHWARALDEELPQGPMTPMRRQLRDEAPTLPLSSQALDEAWRRAAQYDDTHPGLRWRCEALDATARRTAPDWSKGSALALLDAECARQLAERFDAEWRRQHANGWKQARKEFQRVAQRREQLLAQAQRSAAEEVELAQLSLRLDPQADVQHAYREALRQKPDMPEALRGLAVALRDTDRAESQRLAEALYECAIEHRWWAARHVVELLERQVDSLNALKLWRQRLREAEQLEEEAQEELEQAGHLTRPDLNELERDELIAALRRTEGVGAAWLGSRNLRLMPRRRCYWLVLDLPDWDPQQAAAYCDHLARVLPLPGPCWVQALQLGGVSTDRMEPLALNA